MTQTESSTRWVQDKYSDLRGRVLLHIGDHGKAAEFGGYSDGVVLRGERGFAVANEIRSTPNVLIDPELYAADRGRSTESRLRREELCESADRQILAGATCLLVPSRFPSDRSEASLLSVLEAGQEFVESARVPALIPIVIRYDELADRRWVPLVHGEDLPIATIFAGYADPLASPKQLAGAIESSMSPAQRWCCAVIFRLLDSLHSGRRPEPSGRVLRFATFGCRRDGPVQRHAAFSCQQSQVGRR